MIAFNLQRENMRQARARTVMLASCILVVGSSMTHAAPAARDVPSVAVQYGDLNLATEEGAHRLYGRIATAAHKVCERQNSRDLQTFAATKTCESAAIARAVNDVHSPGLAATYAMRIKHDG